MPEHASRFAAALFDQHSDERRIPDWGGDELFTRMPRRRAVDDAPPPRFRASAPEPARALALVGAPPERRREVPSAEWAGQRDRRRASASAEDLPEPAPARAATDAVPETTGARPHVKVITGRPEPLPLPRSVTTPTRRRPARTPAEWVGARPDRIVAWAFALGLLLILIAISTADAATLY
jgi:hypothetical protein